MGAWPSRDSLGEGEGGNLQLFTDNSPIDTLDFLGRESVRNNLSGGVLEETLAKFRFAGSYTDSKDKSYTTGYSGKYFVSECNPNCKLNIHVGAMQIGHWQEPGFQERSIDYYGMGIYISASASDSMCTTAKIRIIQIIRETDGTGNTVNDIADDRKPFAGIQGIGSSEPKNYTGWMVDHNLVANAKSPFVDDTGAGNAGLPADGYPAEVMDRPATLHPKNRGKDAWTCMVCESKNGTTTILGCIHWGYRVDTAGRTEYIEPELSCNPAPLSAAVKRWNKPWFKKNQLKLLLQNTPQNK